MSASLWLVPRDESPFTKTMQELISDTIPSNFPSTLPRNKFSPHVTVTSGIDLDKICGGGGADSKGKRSPQEWLDSLEFPDFKKETNEVIIELDQLQAGGVFFRKMIIKCNEDANLLKLAAQCRAEGVINPTEGDGDKEAAGQKAEKWVRTEFEPHLSLLYSDIDIKDVKNKIPLIELQLGYAIGDLFACCGGALCLGGYLVLVETGKPLDEWKPIAKRETPWAMWRMSKNLI